MYSSNKLPTQCYLFYIIYYTSMREGIGKPKVTYLPTLCVLNVAINVCLVTRAFHAAFIKPHFRGAFIKSAVHGL